ncbi:TRM11 family SAM-dependent methyltransferase [Acidipropionibacterium acidipropionici]|uniref:TRM11 family SAM-dependent methyltransferase n=1 Tax=Acidipropionibacterium acidipropionici TaxID=1748 RepID=UPI00268A2BB4
MRPGPASGGTWKNARVPTCLILLAPSANHVYAGQAPALSAAEIALTCPGVQDVRQTTVAGIDYLELDVDELSEPRLEALSRASASLACFAREGDLLRPVALPATDLVDDDLVTIPKYQGKTNEQFTRLLLNVTLSALRGSPAARRDSGERLSVLDPMCGRGTTLTTCWLAGHNGFGVEDDTRAVEAMAAHLSTWLRRKRLKHTARTSKVRREGRAIGQRFDAELRLPGAEPLTIGVFTGDTRDSASLWGRRTFDAIVTDAPYGVVHGSHTGSGKDRSPAALLAEALPVWAGQLRRGGALGLSWNTHGLAREDLLAMFVKAGLEPLDGAEWSRFSHRVDSSIQRDLAVAVKA